MNKEEKVKKWDLCLENNLFNGLNESLLPKIQEVFEDTLNTNDKLDNNIFIKYPISTFRYPAITSIIMYLCRASLGYNGNYLTIEEYIENLADNALTYSSQDKSYLLLNKELTNLKQSKYSHFTAKC